MNIIKSVDDISSFLQSVSSTNPHPRLVRWNNSSHVCTILNVDDSCIRDPIRSGFGGILRNHSSTHLSSFSGFTNSSKDILFAKLKAIYQGLNLAISLGVEELACYSDSLLAVNLINGDTSQFHIYAVLIQNIKDILGSRNFSLQHSLREGNQCADFMAKLGASTDVELTIHSSPPEDLLPLLRTDKLGASFFFFSVAVFSFSLFTFVTKKKKDELRDHSINFVIIIC